MREMPNTTAAAGGALGGSAVAAWAVMVATLTALLLVSPPGRAIPAFARQMGVECSRCHTDYPQLNAFGRLFKLTGYTLSAGYASLRGDADRAYYGTANGSPDSSWVTLQLDWLPFNKNGGPSLWSWFNPKMSAQYIAYSRFDGTTSGASDNDTFYLQAWLVF
jgi:hypothetical protein